MALFEEPGEELNETPFRSREQRVVYNSPIDLIRQRGSSMVASFFDRTLTPAARQLDLLENENEDEDPPAEESEEEDPEEEESELGSIMTRCSCSCSAWQPSATQT